ncbi:MAG TPA: LysM peptidoglycan-binding domain-containing protein [Clostridiaceae bacterium]|nr:LysM peptidoglycan-binding domain-containing protein [Clostridiaceae bacterium]
MKKRYYLKNKKRFATSILLAILVVFAFLCVTSVYGYKETSYDNVYVKKGDTLWDIAEKYKQRGDIREYIKEIKKINNLESDIIFEGDVLIIPN